MSSLSRSSLDACPSVEDLSFLLGDYHEPVLGGFSFSTSSASNEDAQTLFGTLPGPDLSRAPSGSGALGAAGAESGDMSFAMTPGLANPSLPQMVVPSNFGVAPSQSYSAPTVPITDDASKRLATRFLDAFKKPDKKPSSCIVHLSSMLRTFPEHVFVEDTDEGFLELVYNRDALINKLKASPDFQGLVFTSFERGLKHQGLKVTQSTHGKVKHKRWGFKNPELVFASSQEALRKRERPPADDLSGACLSSSLGAALSEGEDPSMYFMFHQRSSDAHLQMAKSMWDVLQESSGKKQRVF